MCYTETINVTDPKMEVTFLPEKQNTNMEERKKMIFFTLPDKMST